MKKVLLCGFFILLSSTLAHGITCYSCNGPFKDRCQDKAEKCKEGINFCVTESLYSEGGQFRGVYARCPIGSDHWRCGTTLRFVTEIQVLKCCNSDRCNGKRSPFPPPECAKPALG
ncbi:neurotoxin 3FTx-LT-like [Pantherophis guttatus]|uniref:Neurotoxin 3FTx-LT-like n=1 Tax=Pantherophis guttatus TaxID=94885 RepID=A0A6P9CDN4_PANGU|nr:neurotoxin 3FTx-LT-like [Pantherophis guttatus]